MRAFRVLTLVLLIAAGCTIDISKPGNQVRQVTASDSPTSVAVVTATPAPSSAPTTEPTAEPEPTTIPEPDETPVLINGDDWAITQREFDALIDFVEATHELSFLEPVGMILSEDIGAEIAQRFEPFTGRDWLLFRGLGLADSEVERLEANQVRLDRIRGLCCRSVPDLVIVMEVQPSEFETELIIVHELTHALHSQHRELRLDNLDEPTETLWPFQGATEGVPQFVASEFFRQGSAEEQAAAEPNLPVIRDDMLELLVASAAHHLNFAYATGPAFVDAVVAERGIAGLSEVMMSPPSTTEQVMFPQKYLDGEQAAVVPEPDLNTGWRFRKRGTIGSAMLSFLLAEVMTDESAREQVEAWSGDSYVISDRDQSLCLQAMIQMDTQASALSLASGLADALAVTSPDAEVVIEVIDDVFVELEVCRP